jgi:MFS-type transporter involved in bile tolerance (Atg22 family)
VALALVESAAAFVLVAALAGLLNAPVTSSARALLPRLVPPTTLTSAYAVNAVAQEVV